MTLILISIFTAVMAIFTLTPICKVEAWYIRGFDFPRVQFSLLISLLLVAQCIFLDLSSPIAWGLILVALSCLGYQLWWIAPYTPLFPVEVQRAKRSGGLTKPYDTVSILTANVLTPNKNAKGLVDLIKRHQPDIFVTLESDNWWQSQLDVLELDYPHTMKCPLDNLYGMHVYARFPLSKSQIQFLVEDDVPSMHTLIHTPSGHTINAHFLHPAPPSPTENETSEERDAELLVVAKKVSKTDVPTIVAGDLNDVAWSYSTRLFRKISGLLDPRVGRGMYNTYHASYWFMRWPLDHLFHSHHFRLLKIERLPGFGSDHFALLTQLQLEAEAKPVQNTVSLEEGDEAIAQEKIDQQNVEVSDVASFNNSK
ncbi:endonuclease/exonuclease/phosphatase family protein [uncultured Microbulbifer sp.]|uniref:endonuclease/exonuclease/phosphatase family protein n=1 Tax=uncultured Microbulbifer sp. TaxID=348147 RepID=UPI00262F184F|nr:endonuclease/exonuclease/phosphatase family protein [uncultured Microbulbifer sp.]